MRVAVIMLTGLAMFWVGSTPVHGRQRPRPRPRPNRPRQPQRPQVELPSRLPATTAGVARLDSLVGKAMPTEQQLTFYSLDWAGDLALARQRSRKERRPVILIAINNRSGPNEFFSGHC